MTLTKQLKTSLKRFKASLKYLPLWTIIDSAAVVIFFAVLYAAANKITVIFNMMMDAADKANVFIGDSVRSMENTAEVVAQHNQIMEYSYQVMWYVAGVLLAGYILWVVSQSVNWYLTERKVFKRKIKFWPYAGKFALLSIPWYFLLIAALSAFSKMVYSIMMISDGEGSLRVPKDFIVIMLFLISYISFNSYAVAAKGNLRNLFQTTLRVCVHGFGKLVFPYIIFWTLIIIEYKILAYIMITGSEKLLVEPLILLMLAVYLAMLCTLAWMRILAIGLLEKQ